MKLPVVLCCLLSCGLTGFTPLSYGIDLTGRLKNKTGSAPSEVGGLQVFVRGNHRIMAKGKSNARGGFHLYWIDDPRVKMYYFYCVLDQDTIMIGKSSLSESDQPDLTFYLPDM
jgi:hypothetical protein